jgi:phosphocarrier protein
MECEREAFPSDRMVNLEQDFVVPNRLGIHARVAAQIVKLVNQFDCELWIVKDGNKVNGKSILDLLSLMCPQGSRIKVMASGRDAAGALSALAGLFQSKFGES